MNGQEIVSFSKIGQIPDETKFLDGRTMAEYKAVLVDAADKLLSVMPQAVAQVGARDAKIQAESVFKMLVRKAWNGNLDYWTVNQKGQKAITVIADFEFADVIRMICNHAE